MVPHLGDHAFGYVDTHQLGPGPATMHPAQEPTGTAADVKYMCGNEIGRDAPKNTLVNAVEYKPLHERRLISLGPFVKMLASVDVVVVSHNRPQAFNMRKTVAEDGRKFVEEDGVDWVNMP